VTQAEALARGRAALGRHAWGEAYAELCAANAEEALEAEDLVRLASAAALSGHDAASNEHQARAYQAFLNRGDAPAAARCAVWLSMRLMSLGDPIRGQSWLARARRLLDETPLECVERGYLQIALGRQALEGAHDPEQSRAHFEQARQYAERFGDADLAAMALLGLGVCQVQAGQCVDGLACLDEVMLGVEAREVSALVTGIVYCAAISLCHDIFDLRRAHEWTVALSRWCDEQPDLVPFRGQCQVHRAQVLQLHGAWPAAMDIARSVADARDSRSTGPAIGPAFYQQGELHRLRGELSRAEAAYREASRYGYAPEPGQALLRLAQGQAGTAGAAIERALAETPGGPARSRLLPAFVEIKLACGDVDAALAAAQELEALAAELDAASLKAGAAHAMGAALLARGDPRGALASLRQASGGWQGLDAPYEAARTREVIGLAYRTLGDEDHARLELDAAAWALRQLGALLDVKRLEAEAHAPSSRVAADGGLTRREVQVLRLLAAGRTNRAIAEELVLSEKTVARHVSNIFSKLGLASRSAATAYAYEHALV
jgi:ATP/maltotriose-dependent transcriptional regulator MalT